MICTESSSQLVATPDERQMHDGRIDGIDGLRAIAVGLVLAYHLWPNKVPGGFVGVDVFFVLSGFLITTRLIMELRATNGIDLRAFWLRRARRLLPALVLVVVSSTAVAWLVDRNLLVDIARQWFGAFTFSTNWVEIAAGTDYFAATGDQLLNPLWSLAVEEQFYLVWPMAFVFMAKRGVLAARSSGITLIAAGISAVLMAVLLDSPATATRVYYGADTHIFGLMIGASLAYSFADPNNIYYRQRWRYVRQWLGFAALTVFAIVLTTLGSVTSWTYQGGLLIASVLTAVTISTLPGDRTALVNLLERPPLRWLGRHSYGIYLWHWPVLLIVRSLLPPRAPGAGADIQLAALVLIVTVGLSAASFRLVERPINRRGFRAVFADWRQTLSAPSSDGAPRPKLQLLPLGLAAVVVLLALAAITTAPSISEAQRSVEAGQRLIAAQRDSQVNAVGPTTAQGAGSDPAKRPPASVPDQPVVASPTVLVIPTAQSGPNAEPPVAPVQVPTPTAETVPQPTVPDIAPATGPPLSGVDISGVGDSVLSGAAPAMFGRFPGIDIDAAASRQWDDVPQIIDQLIAQGRLRNTVVLSFGTNAGLTDQAHIEGLRNTIERIGPNRRIILVNVVGISFWVQESNDTLVAVASAYPNVTVIDWHGAVENDPSLVHDDRTHPNLRGIAVYAQLIAQALAPEA